MNDPVLKEFLKSAKRIGFFGIGKSNLEIMRLLPTQTEIIIRSESEISLSRIPRGLKVVKILDRASAFEDFSEDILFLSPSVRWERIEFDSARVMGVYPASDLDIFLSQNTGKILAVTGSDGKSTTATLTRELLGNKRAKLLGNIGIPFSTALGKKPAEFSVCELSSFQLRYTKVHAARAAVTNITPNHLNWHKSFDEYKKTKLSLLDLAEDKIISADDPELFEYGKGEKLFAVTSFSTPYPELKELLSADLYLSFDGGWITKNGSPLISVSHILRHEKHNIKNLMTAIALTDGYITNERLKKVAETFPGLSHRCEMVAEFSGIKFINSSIDTSPSRCAATLESLGENIIIILGGKSKGVGYEELREPLSKHTRLAVITGENRENLAKDIKGSVQTAIIEDFEEAVLYAASVAKCGDTVLLSPASASYDAFESFEKRGKKFKEIILDFYKNKEK